MFSIKGSPNLVWEDAEIQKIMQPISLLGAKQQQLTYEIPLNKYAKKFKAPFYYFLFISCDNHFVNYY